MGGVILSNKTFTYSFNPLLGIFRPGAHEGWFGEKYAWPVDENHLNLIDDEDLEKYIKSFYDKQLGTWLEYPSPFYEMGEVFRFFKDENGNQCNNPDVDLQAPIRIKFHHGVLTGDAANAFSILTT